MQPVEASRRTMLTILAAVVSLAALNAAMLPDNEEPGSLVQRVLAHTTKSGVAIRAIRHLEAGAIDGKHHAWMDVETTVMPGGAFSYRVINEGGSDRTREKVFLAVLDAESDAWRGGAHDASILSTANYQLIADPVASAGPARIRVVPRRADSRLVNGILTVQDDGFPIVLQGRLAKSPSFWVKSVTIMKRYARIGGMALPVAIESLADVRIFGKSTFSMRYRYVEVNGRSVTHTASIDTTNNFGPSAEILSLHASLAAPQ